MYIISRRLSPLAYLQSTLLTVQFSAVDKRKLEREAEAEYCRLTWTITPKSKASAKLAQVTKQPNKYDNKP
jgi:hypothetical protein